MNGIALIPMFQILFDTEKSLLETLKNKTPSRSIMLEILCTIENMVVRMGQCFPMPMLTIGWGIIVWNPDKDEPYTDEQVELLYDKAMTEKKLCVYYHKGHFRVDFRNYFVRFGKYVDEGGYV